MHQSITIVGRVGRDPEMRYTPAGQAVTSFSVATSRKYTAPSGEQVEETTWFRVSTWGKRAEACHRYLGKGSLVLVVGRLTPDKATGGPKVYSKQDGATGASYEVTAETVRFLSSRNNQAEGAQAKPNGVEEVNAGAEDIPF